MSTRTIDKNAEELDNTDTVKCDGYCGKAVLEEATVDIVSGEVIDKYEGDNKVPSHLAVTGVDGKYPEREQWCATCAESEFGIQNTMKERTVEMARTRFTRSNLKSFTVGLTMGLLLLIFFLIFLL
jgi:hypothetical protein